MDLILWCSLKNSSQKTREIGFIAQDVDKILSEIGYDDQGFLTEDDKGQLNLRYNDFIPLLTKAMQEQQEIIIKQGEMMNELRDEINELKNK